MTRLCAAWLVPGLWGQPAVGHPGVIHGTLRRLRREVEFDDPGDRVLELGP